LPTSDRPPYDHVPRRGEVTRNGGQLVSNWFEELKHLVPTKQAGVTALVTELVEGPTLDAILAACRRSVAPI